MVSDRIRTALWMTKPRSFDIHEAFYNVHYHHRLRINHAMLSNSENTRSLR
jgi:hypothetical protein